MSRHFTKDKWMADKHKKRHPQLDIQSLQKRKLKLQWDITIYLPEIQSVSHVWLCDPMDCNTPGFPVHRQLLELAQTHVHPVSDAIQPSQPAVPFSSCPQSFPASGSFPMSQLFASADQSIGASASASVLPMNIQDWFPLGWTGWISLQSKGLSRDVFNTTVQKHQFLGPQFSLWSNSHIHSWPLEKPELWKPDSTKGWQGWGATGTFINCWQKCKIIWPLWKTISKFLIKLNIHSAHDPATLLLGVTQVKWKLCSHKTCS